MKGGHTLANAWKPLSVKCEQPPASRVLNEGKTEEEEEEEEKDISRDRNSLHPYHTLWCRFWLTSYIPQLLAAGPKFLERGVSQTFAVGDI